VDAVRIPTSTPKPPTREETRAEIERLQGTSLQPKEDGHHAFTASTRTRDLGVPSHSSSLSLPAS
jgi:hypothetical protein